MGAFRSVFGRRGIDTIFAEHWRTLVVIDDHGRAHKSRADYALFVGIPLAIGIAAAALKVRLHSIDALLTGVSILTGLLFGLLVYILQLGLQARERGESGRDLKQLIAELRANVTWCCFTGIVISIGLVLVASRSDGGGATRPIETAILAALGAHMALTLLMVLNRVRATFNMMMSRMHSTTGSN